METAKDWPISFQLFERYQDVDLDETRRDALRLVPLALIWWCLQR